MLKEIKRQSENLLRNHPEEKEKSTGFVYNNVQLHHVKAAIYLNKNNGMNINAYNLHDLILNYEQYKTLAKCSSDEMVLSDLTNIKPGAFNPKHLFLYFKKVLH